MSNSIIEQMYYNKTKFDEEEFISEEYEKVYNNYTTVYEKLLEAVSEDNKDILQELDECSNSLEALAVMLKFKQGFKAGFKLALEILKD